METPLCRFLDWDSDFFGRRIGRLLPTRLTGELIVAAEQWARQERIDCLYFLAEPDDWLTLRAAEEGGFRLVDIRATFEARMAGRSALSVNAFPAIRRFCEADLPALRSIARLSHRDSRFYFDPGFPDSACDRLYQTWVEKSCAGWAEAVFVADCGNGAVGYATAHRSSESEGTLGLIAVDPRARGAGLGRQLAAAVAEWGRQERLEVVRVVTQGRNCAAMRLYTRCGFLPLSIQLWYHRWFHNSADSPVI